MQGPLSQLEIFSVTGLTPRIPLFLLPPPSCTGSFEGVKMSQGCFFYPWSLQWKHTQAPSPGESSCVGNVGTMKYEQL